MTKELRLFLATLGLLCSTTVLLTSCGKDVDDGERIEEELRPVHPWDWQPDDPELAKGKTIYTNECSLCHNEGEESSPRIGSLSKWQPRIAKGTPKLIENAINGFSGEDGRMPPKGDSDYLTDEEVAAAVKFMVAAPKK